MKLGETGNAITDFTEAIRIDPRNPVAYKNRGAAYEKKGEMPKAKNDFDAAKRLSFKEDEKDWDKPRFFDPDLVTPDNYY